jgi:hypothetical protein
VVIEKITYKAHFVAIFVTGEAGVRCVTGDLRVDRGKLRYWCEGGCR